MKRRRETSTEQHVLAALAKVESTEIAVRRFIAEQ
jgi:hypothetical protein